MFVASHKLEQLKGLIGLGGPRLQDVLALAEGACVMVPVPNQSSSGFSSSSFIYILTGLMVLIFYIRFSSTLVSIELKINNKCTLIAAVK
jgi:hypothetical protein